MKNLIKELVKTQAVKTERHAEDAIIIFFTTTGCLAFIAIAIIIDCIL
jgi:predicted signal transduction protein with EAL and GGDEF domain